MQCLRLITVTGLVFASPYALGQPTLAIKLVPKVSIIALPGTVSAVEYTTNPVDPSSWATLGTVRVTQSPFGFIDSAGTVFPQRYYRAVTISTNPGPIDMVWIPPGTFTMGSPTNEAGHSPNEGPLTIVNITRGFWIGRYELTQSQFTNVMGPWTFSFSGSNLPAETVLWSDAINYCSRLTDAERQAGRLPAGYVYRLPSEAEWDYAARAGSTNRYFFGDDTTEAVLSDYAWYSLNANSETHPVGTKQPNAWGLYDVAGNVCEWCLDFYSSGLPGGTVTDPVGPSSGPKVYKGGSWLATATQARSAMRFSGFGSSGFVGFRLVLGPPLQ